MKSQALLIILTVSIGIVIGVAIGREQDATPLDPPAMATLAQTNPATETPPTSGAGGYDEAIQQLRTLLQQEREQRLQLEQRVTALAGDIEDLLHTSRDDDAQNDGRTSKTIRTGKRDALTRQNSGWINANLLIAAGLEQSEVKRITDVYESVEMEKLVIIDKARREGWMGSERFRTEMDNLNSRTENLRSELGEQGYDALLYASGRPNRVYVSGTLGNSPAAQAGIQPGDAILRYAGERVYSWTDLRQATGRGDANEVVPVEIERDNRTLEVYIKRGPLGVRLDQQSVNPAS